MITRRSLLSYAGLGAAAIAGSAGLSTIPAAAKRGKSRKQRRNDRRRNRKQHRRNHK